MIVDAASRVQPSESIELDKYIVQIDELKQDAMKKEAHIGHLLQSGRTTNNANEDPNKKRPAVRSSFKPPTLRLLSPPKNTPPSATVELSESSAKKVQKHMRESVQSLFDEDDEDDHGHDDSSKQHHAHDLHSDSRRIDGSKRLKTDHKADPQPLQMSAVNKSKDATSRKSSDDGRSRE